MKSINTIVTMDDIVKEMYEDFIMSGACSKYYSRSMEDYNHEAQDILYSYRYLRHAKLCEKAAEACKEYLKTKNKSKLLTRFLFLGLKENVLILKRIRK